MRGLRLPISVAMSVGFGSICVRATGESMTIAGWVQVGADPETLEEAEKLVEQLSSSGLRLTRAQVLRAALAKGVKAIKKDPSSLVSRDRK